MTLLVPLFLAAGASAALAVWQQQAINNVRAETTRLSTQILQTRSALEARQSSLATARADLKRIEADLAVAKHDHAAGTLASPSPTPEQEGWWPQDRPYFYLVKTLLPKVRFEERPAPAEPAPGEESQDAGAATGYFWVSYQVFDEDRLHPHLAVLLGMSDEEVTTVNERYTDLMRGVRNLEVSRLERVDPPEPVGDGHLKVVARLPVLTSDLQPLLERWEQGLGQGLGRGRAEILGDHARRYFGEHLDQVDQMGGEPREFLSDGRSLWVRFNGPYGAHMARTGYSLQWNNSTQGQDWEYGHLFGPGAPGELRHATWPAQPGVPQPEPAAVWPE